MKKINNKFTTYKSLITTRESFSVRCDREGELVPVTCKSTNTYIVCTYLSVFLWFFFLFDTATTNLRVIYAAVLFVFDERNTSNRELKKKKIQRNLPHLHTY